MKSQFVATNEGLGLLINRFTRRLAMDDAFAVLLVLMGIGLILYALLTLLERRIVFWTHDSRLSRRR